jgi:AraC-like DNA-binding protein
MLDATAYREHAPAAPLRSSVECYWTRRGTGAPQRVLPDGCIDILMRRPVSPTGAPHGCFRAEVIGTMTRAIVAGGAAEELVGIRFRPGEAFRFLRFPAVECTDLDLDLEAVRGSFARDLAEGLDAAEGLAARVSALDRALLRRHESSIPADFRVRHAVDSLRRGQRSIAALACEVGISTRQLHRLFDERVGIGPRALARVFRVQRGVTLLSVGASPAWSRIALEAGYADQSHLIREFQALVGVSPTAFVRARAMSDSFNPGGDGAGT